jgi:hypothetical protein
VVKKLAIFFISLVALLASGGTVMYSVRSLGPDIVMSIESIDMTETQAESAGYSEAGSDEISIRRMLERSFYQDSPNYHTPTSTDQEHLTK